MKKLLFSLSLVLAMSTSFAQTNSEELTTEPTVLAEKYNKLAKENLAKGDVTKASQDLAKLSKYENGKVWQVKNKDTKKDEFYYSQADLDKATAAGNYAKAKEVALQPKYGFLLQSEVSTLANKELDAANKAMDAKQYTEAGTKFLNVYNLVEALGTKEDIYKYQAAICFYNANDYDKSLTILKELAAKGFTGKSANQTKDYNRDMYILALNGLYNAKKHDAIVEEAIDKYPTDADINTIATAIYQVSGNSDKMLKRIEEAIKINPNDAQNYYNLGVLYLDDKSKTEEAKKMFQKSIELNPKHFESYNNLVLAILQADKEIVEAMNNNLGTSKKEKEIYNANETKRKALFTEAVPYLEKMYEIQPENRLVIRNLIQAYKTLGNDQKETFYREAEKKTLK
ncbi:tetratricopeptide repeat protein [Empedobacter stercoris]|uniref:Tetratricopeptide repeat protein n=1 Tax=Empedobacter falsenii TaxID=343874 RepID=A0ABY8V9H1_9FLAO|nr:MULTISPECIES: tetratricopeptide repeat protein [Empedobacter]MCA4809719.1 tetratricopeptide repeat protein [Empedobacter stercoris]QNT14749.1 tetratricopeptide repeat protein [Empedobacter stercoris]UWX66732.1 tetratricopeptide repeat protein [Empedobacter stercoris]WIH96909.1 tetratricopeptide repeat protein [Empedobacter falsenii]